MPLTPVSVRLAPGVSPGTVTYVTMSVKWRAVALPAPGHGHRPSLPTGSNVVHARRAAPGRQSAGNASADCVIDGATERDGVRVRVGVCDGVCAGVPLRVPVRERVDVRVSDRVGGGVLDAVRVALSDRVLLRVALSVRVPLGDAGDADTDRVGVGDDALSTVACARNRRDRRQRLPASDVQAHESCGCDTLSDVPKRPIPHTKRETNTAIAHAMSWHTVTVRE